MIAGFPRASGDFTFTLRATSSDGVTATGATRTFGVSAVRPVLVTTKVVEQLFDGTGLTMDERRFLDYVGNANGKVDVGDVRAWLIANGLTARQAAALAAPIDAGETTGRAAREERP